MIDRLTFYVRHSLNDLRVNGRRTFFGLLCIAAGVAAVVSLQTVAVMIGDTLTGNLQETNRGDIQVSLETAAPGSNPALEQAAAEGILEAQPPSVFFGQSGPVEYRLGEEGIAHIQQWIDANYPGQIEMTYPWVITDLVGIFTGGVGTSVTATSTGAEVGQVAPLLIDPTIYPFYGHVQSSDGTPLADLMQSPTDIVIDQKVAGTLGATVGDTLRINGASTDFTLRGIVPTEVEVTDPASSLFLALFGFYYLDRDAVQYFDGVTPQTNKLYFKLSNPEQVTEINRAFLSVYPYLQTTTTTTMAEQNQGVSDLISRMVTVVGLVSLLLGSIGIINTMQVIVRRRTVEVAVLKTMGLQAGEVTMLFLVEAFIMGVVGSLAGIVLGWATTFVIKGVAEAVVAQSLPFRIAVQPVVNGFVVGTLVTTIFGFLPTLAAGQVRPAVVLRPNDNVIPRAGRVRTALALVVIILALSFVASLILGSFPTALAVTVGAFLAAGLLVLLLSALIWLIGRFFPSLGIVDLKISLRQMLAGRGRGATTLLALVVGVFSLSLITMFATSVNNTLSAALGAGGGGNVLILLLNQNAIPGVTAALDATEGVSDYQVLRRYDGTLLSVETTDGAILTREQIAARIAENSALDEALEAFGANADDANAGEMGLSMLSELTGSDLSRPLATPIQAGRAFTEVDAGQPVMVMTDSSTVQDAGLRVGDRLTYAFGEGADAPQIAFELIGIAQRPAVETLAGGSGIYVPVDALAAVQPGGVQVFANVEEARIPELRRSLASVPGATVLETAVFSRLITGLLGTFSAFPTMVALLGMIVGGVVIANSVALTTMERRREIAVMKAVGLQRERVLGMLLLENGLMGLVGGLIGVGLGVLMLAVPLAVTGGAGGIPYDTALLLMLLCIAISLVAAVTSAWGASGEKPLNVLRYE